MMCNLMADESLALTVLTLIRHVRHAWDEMAFSVATFSEDSGHFLEQPAGIPGTNGLKHAKHQLIRQHERRDT